MLALPLAQVALVKGRGEPVVYTVPPDLAGRVSPGSRVVAPLGAGRVAGVVLGVPSGEASFFGAPRAILEAPDDEPAIPADLLELARWAAAYYLCPIGEILSAILPGSLSLARDRTVRLTPAGELEASSLLLPADPGERISAALLRRTFGARTVILRALLDAGAAGMERGRIVGRAGGGGSGTLEALGKQGLVETTEKAGSLPGLLPLRAAAGRRAAADETIAVRPPVARWTPTQAQANAIDAVVSCFAEPREALPPDAPPTPSLLFGVTGSGKTEVYFRIIEASLAAGRGAIYLVPEIGLTPLLARLMRERFGDDVAVLHSRLATAERRREWGRLRRGEARIALGPRSAVFAPVPSPGCIIVDEEHDPSYKQQDSPRYQARDLALVRGRLAGAAVVLGSATPSLESWKHAEEGKYRRLDMPARVEGRPLPRVELVDMRAEFRDTGAVAPLSRRLIGALRERLERGEQAIVLLNRRGWAPSLRCRACGESVACKRCSVGMVLHRSDGQLRCHYCTARRAPPVLCPSCGSRWLQPMGEGTERIEEELLRFVPGVRIARMDSDSVRERGAAEKLLAGFERGDADLLVGTQMVSKGHDFPRVTLVGVLLADAALALPDFRAGERTFQLLSQVTGRSGRGESAGEVILQAFQPDHEILQAAARHDSQAFYEREMALRRALRYPPFTSLAVVLSQDTTRERAIEAAEAAAVALRTRDGIEVMGPAPAPLERIRRRWRVQVIARCVSRRRLGAALATMLERTAEGGHARRLSIDIDPVTVL